jgi:heterodisulfide reductase subunit A-like polyferredoxin
MSVRVSPQISRRAAGLKDQKETKHMTNTVNVNVRQTGRNRAIVMGGSIAGLAAARVLSEHFRQVILVE